MLTLTSPVETFAHRWRPGAKVGGLCLFTLALVRLNTPLPLALSLAGVLALALACGTAFTGALIRSLRPLWPFLAILALWHLITADIQAGFVIALRMITGVTAATFVTMTTPLSTMLALFLWLLTPLARAGLRPKPLAIALALMIRFIPVMLTRFDQQAAAWRARSVRRAGWHVLMPATLAALDDAAHVAEALRARGGAE